jgi:hypothetical protein
MTVLTHFLLTSLSFNKSFILSRLRTIYYVLFNNVTVNERPSQFIPVNKRTSGDHAIIIQYVVIPLHIVGVTSYFTVIKPNEVEMNDDVTYRHIHAKNETYSDPTNTTVSDNELSVQYTIPHQISGTLDRYVSSIRK